MNIIKTIWWVFLGMGLLIGYSLPVYAMTPIRITSNLTKDAEPYIYHGQLVWQEMVNSTWEIFHYNISTGKTTRLTNNTVDDMFPRTDGNYVVWLGDGMNGALSFYNIASGVTLVIPEGEGDFIKSPPQIANGYITWAMSPVAASVEPGDIYLYNIASGVTTNISALVDSGNQLEDMGPRISDSLVGWLQMDDLGNDDPEDDVERFMLYDIGAGTVAAAPGDFIWRESRQSDGDQSVLLKKDGNDREIFIQRGMKSIQVTDNSVDDSWPCISGTTVAWVSGSGEAAEIYIADTDSNAAEVRKFPWSLFLGAILKAGLDR